MCIEGSGVRILVGFTMLSTLLLLGFLGCRGSSTPEAPPRAAIGVLVPRTGPDAEVGEAAVRGVQLAAGTEADVVVQDDVVAGGRDALLADERVIGAVAHVGRGTAEREADAWRASALPVVIAAPGALDGLPRVVPPLPDAARCAAALVEGGFQLRLDNGETSAVAAQALYDATREAIDMEIVDGSQAALQAAKLAKLHADAEALRKKKETPIGVVWVGDPKAGGSFLRVLRQVGDTAPFFAVGGYDPGFLVAAGDAADGARVSALGRPARDASFVDAYTRRFGTPPTAVAVNSYEAAQLLLAAWRAAAGSGQTLTRDAVRDQLRRVEARGASGPVHIDERGVASPVLCASFVVRDGKFELERISEPPAPG